MRTSKPHITKRVLVNMLKENTGSHFLDSGGAYGRNWQRNQVRDFDKEPVVVVDGECVQVNVYHFLLDRVDYLPDLQREFGVFARRKEFEDAGWLCIALEFAEQRTTDKLSVNEVNTYNGEDLLSQVLQYVTFEIDGDTVCLLQIHGGCDVRGGYTKPRAFLLHEEYSLYDNARLFASCDGEERHSWSTDDAGSHWYADMSAEPELKSLTEPCPACGAKLNIGI